MERAEAKVLADITPPRRLVISVAVIMGLSGLFSPQPILTVVASFVFACSILLVWFRDEPPIFPFICAMQWLQSGVPVLYANVTKQQLSNLYPLGKPDQAALHSLIALLVLAAGIRIAYRRKSSSTSSLMMQEIAQMDLKKIMGFYLFSFCIAILFRAISSDFGALRQLILPITALKWVAFFAFALGSLVQRRFYSALLLCTLFEFTIGFLGYFSSFKNVFFILFTALLASRNAFKGGKLAVVIGLSAILLFIGVVWSTVKGEYRDYISGGARAQIVTVSIPERFEKLKQLVSEIHANKLAEGADAMVRRLAYIEYFGIVIDNVPTRIPYAGGELWRGAVEHVLKPRLFFPGKRSIDDSERTRLYTGIDVAGAEQGTSISLGYIAESYIDFGPFGMYVPILVLGMLLASIYNYFISKTSLKILGVAMAISILAFGAYNIETSNIKLVGGLITSTIAFAVINFLISQKLSQFLLPQVSIATQRISSRVKINHHKA